ncbi:MAG: hypothetical protein XU15_C0005G0061 [candidate division NC10 bacterium CSP1-5]|nr:MAG: hypothetical protein XU15_C0005G0061 [candidate division NC10 bacterium CSP1-5]
MIQTERKAVAKVMAIPEPIQVSCYAGSRGVEAPRAFRSPTAGRLVVVRILKRWLQEDLRRVQKEYFQVLASNAETYILYRDCSLDLWFLEGKDPEYRGAQP